LKRGATPPRWPRTEHASDGTAYEVRPIRPDDAQRERDFIARLSPQSRYQRFQHDLSEPDAQLIDRFVHVDQHRTNERMMDLAKWLGLRVDPPRGGESLARAWRRLR